MLFFYMVCVGICGGFVGVVLIWVYEVFVWVGI